MCRRQGLRPKWGRAAVAPGVVPLSRNSEFSRAVGIEPWPEAGIAVELAATPEECQALAERFSLVGLRDLKASGRLERPAGAGGELVLRCHLTASPVQSCVVTLEPVATRVDETIERRFRRVSAAELAAEAAALAEEVEMSEVEPLVGSQLDLGEVVAEEFGLALDPYPRAADAEAALAGQQLGPTVTINADERAESPFAGLAELKPRAPG